MFRSTFALALTMVAAAAGVDAQQRPIDPEHSTVTVFVAKSGLFSAFADDHVIRAPIASGSLSPADPPAVALSVRAASLVVLDPKLSAGKRAEVQTRMLGPDVLDAKRYSDITFASTAIAPAGAEVWTVTGRLTIHGETRTTTLRVKHEAGRYRGTVTLKQTDFGIRPISIMGGTVKVKNELSVEFDIVAQKSD